MNDWTVSTLKEYVTALLDLREKRWLDRFEGIKDSTVAAKSAADQAAIVLAEVRRIRDEGQNEWRRTVEDMKAGYAPADFVKETDRRFEELAKRVSALEKSGGSEEGRRNGIYAVIGAAVGIGGLLIALLT